MCEAIESEHYSCWMAPRNITPGRDWGAEIIDGIDRSSLMVVIFSESSNRSKHVVRELGRAVDKGVIIIPFRISDVPLSQSVAYFLSNAHWLDAIGEPLERHLKTLKWTIAKLLTGDAKAVEKISPAYSRKKRGSSGWGMGIAAGMAAIAVVAVISFFGAKGLRNDQPSDSKEALNSDESPSPNPVVSAASSEPLAHASTVSPPAPKAVENPDSLISEYALMGGSLKFESGGVQVLSVGSIKKDDGDTPGGRVSVISNYSPASFADYEAEDFAILSFQLKNLSEEGAILSDLQVVSLGVVQFYEDEISEPMGPAAIAIGEKVNIRWSADGMTGTLDLKSLFSDVDTPWEDLEFSTFSLEAGVNTDIEGGNLIIHLQRLLDHEVDIWSSVKDPFSLSADGNFRIVPLPGGLVAERVAGALRGVAGEDSHSWSVGSMASSFPVNGNNPEAAKPIDRVMDLGTVAGLFRLAPMQQVNPTGSGNLLPPGETLVMGPKSFQHCQVRLVCQATIDFSSFEQTSDIMVSPTDERRRLEVPLPALTKIAALFVMRGRLDTASGETVPIYSDRLFLVKLEPGDASSREKTGSSGRSMPVLTLTEANALTPEAVYKRLLGDAVIEYEESIAYQRAQDCQSVPGSLTNPFDPKRPTAFCYYGNGDSLFRGEKSRIPNKTIPASRSNLFTLSPQIQKEVPEITQLWERFSDFWIGGEDLVLGEKVKALTAIPPFEPTPEPSPAKIRVEMR